MPNSGAAASYPIVSLITISLFSMKVPGVREESPASRATWARILLSVPFAMHAIFFATKRAFHGVLRVTRKPLESFGLTAARFDLMFALLQSDLEVRYPVRQSEMRRRLGVSAPLGHPD
jgi:hypothetical protein